MKKFIVALLLISALAGCDSKSDPVDPNTPVLLLGYQVFDGSTSEQIAFDYDQQNRLTRVSRLQTNQTFTVLYNISYDNGSVTISRPVLDNDTITDNSSATLYLDNNQRVVKRVANEFLEFKEPANPPQRSYIYDSLGFEYDNAGLLIARNGIRLDSTWFNPGSEQISMDTQIITQTFTNNNNQLTSSEKVTLYNSQTIQNGNSVYSSRSTEETITYSYTSNFANKTDFLNHQILQELDIFQQGLVSQLYTMMPNRIAYVITDKDEGGNVTNTSTGESNRLLAYNDAGYIISITEAADPTRKTIYYYNR